MNAASRTGGVDFDAQAAAREAARREGKSLGQWLHGAIADRAADLGIRESDLAGRERIEAVTARLERLGGRAAAPSRRHAHAGRGDGNRSRLPDSRDAQADERRFARRGAAAAAARPGPGRDWADEAPGEDEAETLLAGAISAMERRAARSERRTDEALASFAHIMEANEARRVQERGAVQALTQQMAALEASLTERFASGDNPIKGALARLEARLDLIGKRSAAESAARQHAAAEAGDGEAVRRLEDKINALMQTMHGGAAAPAASPLAVKAAQAAEPGRRRLGDAIAEIARRQQSLDEAVDRRGDGRPPRAADDETPAAARAEAAPARPASARPKPVRVAPAEQAAADGPRLVFPLTPRQAAKAGGHSAEPGGPGPAGPVPQATAGRDAMPSREQGRQNRGRLDEEVAALAARVTALQSATREGGQADAARAVPDPATAEGLAKIERRLDVIAGRVRDVLQRPPAEPPRAELGALEAMVRDLAAKLDAAGAPSADAQVLDALQSQVEVLATRFERSEHDLSLLPTLAASVRGLVDQLETVRASVETSAAHAAREVLRIAADDRRRAPAAEADAVEAAPDVVSPDVVSAVQSMMGGVHDMLDKVVGRLSAVESNLADVRNRPAAAAPAPQHAASAQPARSDAAPDHAAPHRAAPGHAAPAGPVFRPATQRPAAPRMAAPGEPSDLAFGGEREPILPPSGGRRAEAPPAGRAGAADADEAQRVNFIAAARRAAKTAQTGAAPAQPGVAPAEAAARSPKRPAAATEADARAGLLAKSRDYVAAHKRPVLMGLAAILVVAGTLALLQRTNLAGGDPLATAFAPQPVKVAQLADPLPASRRQAPLAAVAADPTPSAPSRAPAAAAPAATGASDPLPTGSLTSLPAFAAQGGVGRPAGGPAGGLPVGLQTAAEAGNPAAQYELGLRYAEGRAVARDMKLAALWLGKAADGGLVPAQYRLASFFEKGIGVAQDKAKARDLYTRAAEAGNPRAMHNLAVMLADGDGHPDYPGAAGWFRKAAAYGIHDSQYNLAILLARGLGVSQSLIQSYQWFAVAAAGDDADAAHKRDEVGSKLNGNDLVVAKSLAAAFQPKVADPAATEVAPSPGWDGAPGASHLNSVKSRISAL